MSRRPVDQAARPEQRDESRPPGGQVRCSARWRILGDALDGLGQPPPHIGRRPERDDGRAHDGRAAAVHSDHRQTERHRLADDPAALLMHAREEEHVGGAHVVVDGRAIEPAEELDAIGDASLTGQLLESGAVRAVAQDLQPPAGEVDDGLDREVRALPWDQPAGE